jgi:hypothetical protein
VSSPSSSADTQSTGVPFSPSASSSNNSSTDDVQNNQNNSIYNAVALANVPTIRGTNLDTTS